MLMKVYVNFDVDVVLLISALYYSVSVFCLLLLFTCRCIIVTRWSEPG